ncbi:MAG TPA: hypothetical protein VGD40_26170 [Chryseosolibacter sp.]
MFCWLKRTAGFILQGLMIFFIASIFFACGNNTQTTKLYNIDSLVNEQVRLLSSGKPKLTKQAVMGSQQDAMEYVPDSAAWSQELDIFRQLDAMNKPVNRSKYLVDDNLYDPGSNLTVKAFTSLEPLPVRSMRIFYDTDMAEPRKIEAIFREENTLFESSKNLLLEFQQINNKNLLTSYSIEGGQKMILSDSVTFSVKGKIKF